MKNGTCSSSFFSSRVIELMTEEFTEMNVFMGSNYESVERRCVPFYQCFQFLKCIFGASSRLEPLIFFFLCINLLYEAG